MSFPTSLLAIILLNCLRYDLLPVYGCFPACVDSARIRKRLLFQTGHLTRASTYFWAWQGMKLRLIIMVVRCVSVTVAAAEMSPLNGDK